AAGETEAALAVARHPFLFQTVRAERGRRAGLRGAAAAHLVDDRLAMTVLGARLVLLEKPPGIADDLLAGVFVDPLPGGGHGARLYHGRALGSTRLYIPVLPSSPSEGTGRRGDFQKRKFLDARDTRRPARIGP